MDEDDDDETTAEDEPVDDDVETAVISSRNLGKYRLVNLEDHTTWRWEAGSWVVDPHAWPPEGWFTFGSHVEWDGELEFSKETDDGGMPRWERPLPVKHTAVQTVEDFLGEHP